MENEEFSQQIVLKQLDKHMQKIMNLNRNLPHYMESNSKCTTDLNNKM